MAKNSMEYSDIFCQAVQNIVNGSVSNLNFDMSKECAITKIINKSYGRYEVYDGSISFEAVATEGSTYQVGDSVMVTIPQGDSNKQIIILNKIVDEWTGPAGFVRPLDTLVSCTGNIAFNKAKQMSLKANGEKARENILTLKNQKFFGFQKVGISAKFRTLLSDLGVSDGDYGLIFTLIQTSNNADIPNSVKQYRFSCSDMLGDPYAFNSYFQQEYAFDIDEDMTQINELTVDFYQNSGFKDGNGNKIVESGYMNLFVKDLEIYFGYPQDKEISEIVEIYSDNFEYSGNGPGSKWVYLQWIHKTDDYHLEHVTKEEYLKENSPYEVRWYQYTSGCDDSKTDEYGGKHWELLNKVEPSFVSTNYPFEFMVNVRPTYIEEQIKAICLVKTHPLTNDPTYEQIIRFDSNILTFENLQEEAGEDAPPQEILQKNLSLHFHDNSYGNYFLYDQNGRLIDSANQGESHKRQIEIFYDGDSITKNADWYNSIQAISWEVPAPNQTNSMIYYSNYYNKESFVEPNENLLYSAEKEAYSLSEEQLKKQGYTGTIEEMRKAFISNNENKAININNWKKVIVSSDGKQQDLVSDSISSNDTSSSIDLPRDFLTVDKFLDETKYLVVELDNNINGKFNLTAEKIKISINGASSIPKNLTATLKMSVWIYNNEEWNDSDHNSGQKWILINNQHQNFYLKDSITIDNISKLCPITREHMKVIIGFGFIFNKNNEDFNQFITDNPDVKFNLYLDDSTKINFSVQSEFYTNTIYPVSGEKLNTYFDYSISNVWYKDRSNNTIRCRVTIDDRDYLLQEELRFGTKGSNGTNNTLILEMMDGKNSIVFKPNDDKTAKVDDEYGILKVDAMLIKGDGQRVYLDSSQIDWKLLNENTNYYQSIEKTGSSAILKLKNIKSVPKDNYAILKASVKYGTETNSPTLEAYLPIPIRHYTCIGMGGTKEIIYNSQGVPPLSNEVYIAYMNDGEQYSDGWSVSEPTDSNGKSLNPNPVKLQAGASGTGKSLGVTSLFSKGSGDGPIYDKSCVYCIKDGTVIWSQPILIMQSAYDFAMLNSWDGKLTIDETNGTILSAMIGAGKKHGDNTFSGVLLGDVETGTGNDSISQTGVYGFEKGRITYALKEDGSGFFGADGCGRIEFDGGKGTISSSGWIKSGEKWQLKQDTTTGSIFDFNNAKLRLQADNHYIDFNNEASGVLKMALSGANINLTDKSNKTLSGYIDVTAQGLTSEFRRGAVYTATCETKAAEKTIAISKFKQYGVSGLNISAGINQLSSSDILQDGVTIAVTFTQSEEVTSNFLNIEESIQETATTTKTRVVGSIEKRVGRALDLKIGDKSKPIYINGKPTNNKPSIKFKNEIDDPNNSIINKINKNKSLTVEESKQVIPNSDSNPFGWSANSVIYFTYNEKQNDKGEDVSYWEVSDGGSYSRISQTADEIISEVSTIGGNLSSSIIQTAKNIRMEVDKKANYKCSCSTEDSTVTGGSTTKTIDNFPISVISSNSDNSPSGISAGCIMTVTFSKKEKSGAKQFSINGNIYSISGGPTWNSGETLPFMYDGESWNMTSISNASVDIRDNRITSEVRRTAGYVCTYPDEAPTNDVYTVTLLNPSDGLTVNDILQDGVTLAVTFNRARTSASTSGLKLEVKFADKTTAQKSIYFKGKAANEENYSDGKHFTWAKGDTIYFAYSSNRWNIVDSGAYSKITQTADSLVAKVGGDIESFSWVLEKDHFSLYSGKQSVENRVFYCNSEGIEVNGKITATSGKIGDFFISGNVLMTENYIQVKDGKVVTDSKTNNPVYVTEENGYKDGVYIGPDCIKLGKYFQLNKNGYLYAKRGQIGGIDIYNSHLGTEGATFGDATGGVYIGPDGINIANMIKLNKDGTASFEGTVSASNISGTLDKDQITTIVTSVVDRAESFMDQIEGAATPIGSTFYFSTLYVRNRVGQWRQILPD